MTSTEVMSVPAQTALASPSMNREQVELLKRTVCKGASDDEFKMFLEICQRRKVDPFSKMLYLVPRWDSKLRREVMAVQSSIDYFRLTAGRSDKYAGQAGPQWCGQDGAWKDVWLEKDPPRAARVGVMCKDFKEPLWAVALWDSYVQRTKEGSPSKFWKDMGSLMLGKCAEALAIRRAFPEDLAGLYTPEEMQQDVREVEHVEVAAEPTKPQPPKTLAQAAERAQAPRTVEAQPVPPKQPEPAQAIVDDGTAPVLEKLPNGYRYWGCFIEAKIVDNYNRWKSYQVESKKDKYVNGKPWAEMPFGEKGGGREGWLSSVAAWCAGIQDTEHKSNQLGERAAYSLFLMHDRFYREAQEQVLNGEFEERTGIHIDPDGTSEESTPFWP